MNRQLEESCQDIVPLRPLERLKEDEAESNRTLRSEIKRQARKSGQNPIHASHARNKGINYDIAGEATYQDAISAIEGEKGLVIDERIDRDGILDRQRPFDGECDLEDYLKYLFFEDEVEEVYKVDVARGGRSGWTESYWTVGYSNTETRIFGPSNQFEGPILKYAFIGYKDPEEDLFFNQSSIDAVKIHPGYQLDEYRQEGESIEHILQEGAAQYSL